MDVSASANWLPEAISSVVLRHGPPCEVQLLQLQTDVRVILSERDVRS